MKLRRSILALCAFFVLGAGVAACGSAVPGDSVAVIGGNPITTRAFNHWMFVAAKSQAAQSPGQPVIVPNDPPKFTKCIADIKQAVPTFAKGKTDKALQSTCKSLFTQLANEVMDFLVKAYWYQADAAKLHVSVSDAQVKKAFTAAKNQQFQSSAQFQTFLSQTGQTLDDILYRFRINQLFTKLVAKYKGKVTPAQIQAYYNSHLSQFGTPETRDMRIVLAKTQADATKAMNALKHGQSWAKVAKQYSTDQTTKNAGGQLVGVSKGQQDSALDQAAFAAPVNKVLGPVKGQFGYYIFEVTKITKATQQSLAQATPLITQTLTSQTQTSAQSLVDKHAKKDWLSKTKCRSQYVMADCSGYKAPKTSTTPGATTTTGG